MNTILQAKKTYTPDQVVMIDSTIRRLARDHYKYGKNMPLVYGKARGIQAVLECHYDVHVSLQYVWNVLEEFKNEPEGGWNE